MASESSQHCSEVYINSLPYVSKLAQRNLSDIEGVVIHATELPDLATAREYGERVLYESGTGNSGHFYIDRDGSVHRWVPLDRVAHHVSDWNAHTIGIELVNRGRYPDWLHSGSQDWTEPYPEAQIDALISLLATLEDDLPQFSWIAGHAELDLRTVSASDNPAIQVRRKLDPGATFPWPRVVGAVRLKREPILR